MEQIEKDQDRAAFEQAMSEEGFYTPLRRIGPASIRAGEYAEIMTQTCWNVWQMALKYARKESGREKDEQHST